MNSKLLLLVFALYGPKLQGQTLPYYSKPLLAFDYTEPLFKFTNEQLRNENGFLRFTALSGYREGVASLKTLGKFDIYRDTNQRTSRIYLINLSLVDLISFGLAKPGRVILDVKEPGKFSYTFAQGSKLGWMRQYAYCYEKLVPYGVTIDPKEIQEELCEYLGITFGIETKIVKTCVLKRKLNSREAKSTYGPSKINHTDIDGFTVMKLGGLASFFASAGLPTLINESGYDDNWEIMIKYPHCKEIEVLKNELSKYNLELIQDQREIEMYVIHDNKRL
jgi:hypothetical protein